MSYRVSIIAETPEELQKKIAALLDKGVFATRLTTDHGLESLKTLNLQSTEEDDDTLEDVPSPFATAPSSEGVELDQQGIPWDKRIHAKTKTKVKDGTWKIARGVTDEEANKVLAELRKTSSYRPAPVAAPAPVVVTAPAPAPQVQATLATALPVMGAPLPQMHTGGHTLETFNQNFPMVITGLINEKKIDQNYLNQWKQYFNVQEIWQTSPEQKAVLFDQFVQYGFIQRVG